MSLTVQETAHVLLALALLLVAAHGGGFFFAHFRQPRVIGEILGGLLLGPTVLGFFFPETMTVIFPDYDRVTMPVLGAVYQLGLLLLMFCSGLEVRSSFQAGERKTALLITATGTILPFLLGLGLLKLAGGAEGGFLDVSRFYGEHANPTAFLLVFAIAVAVTSIPVISRIMFDLGLLETAFARIVLGAAVIEDILLYIVLAIALGTVGAAEAGSTEVFGLPGLLDFSPTGAGMSIYHVAAPLVFIGLSLAIGPVLFERVRLFRYNLIARSSPIAFLLVFMLVMTGICVFLGITPMFGAFVAGMVVGSQNRELAEPRGAIKQFSFAFFIPVYFAIVGLKLNLARDFEIGYFLFFLAFACIAKSLSVYLGARAARESGAGALNLAVAMNARGGPGIVLASVAFDAGIINEPFYSKLVLLAIVTSLLAGTWLERVVRSGRPLR
ncbi:MAG: cation:proton antiporter [Planctomycetota bacterium]